MASGTFYPAVSGDDGFWLGSVLDTTDDVVKLGDSYGDSLHGFFRFPSVTIPKGATIITAQLRIYCGNSVSGTTVNLNVYANDADAAVAPTTAAEADALVLTSAVTWDDLTACSSFSYRSPPDITTIIQTVVDRSGWSSGNALQIIVKNNGSDFGRYRHFFGIDYDSGNYKAELHVTWTPSNLVEISEEINVLSEFDVSFGELNEDVNVLSEFDNNWPEVDENVSINAEFLALGSDGLDEEASVNSELIAAHSGELSEDASVNAAFISEHTGELSEDASVNTEFEVAILETIQDTLSSWDNLKWGWQKSIADSLAIADTAEKILGIPVKDWLAIKDSELTNWNGVESVSDSFYAVDMSKVIKVYFDLVADGMAVADAVKSALGLIIKDIFTCVDTALNIGQFQHSISDLLTLEDIAKRFFPKSVSDSFAVADISLVDFLVLLQISDSLTMVDTADRLLTINKAIADSLGVLDVVTIKQLIQELMQDGLNISASVIIDGEVYECWVLNTSSFHPSVYSNYEFNSFCIDKSNNICYGCKSDGIYTLEGDTDNGTDIKAGIILPDTDFGSSNKKRFRKAWLAVEGNNLLLKAETESGSRTYGMTDAEISLTRDLKGRSWKFSVEGFDSLDSINLVPIILSKR